MPSPETIARAATVCGILIIMDILAGIARAASNGEIRTPILRAGLWHKLAVVMAFVLAIVLEYAETVLPLGIELPLLVPVSCYICIMEACSIYENLKGINPDMKIEKFEDLFKLEKEREERPIVMDEDALRAAERYMRKFIEENEEEVHE